MWESGIKDVADPLAGSYYVEWLTDRIEQEAWKLFHELEERGGYMKGLKDGWIKRTIDNSAYLRKKAIKSGELPVVGVNRYVGAEKEEHQPFRVDYEVERKAVERLRAFRNKRNPRDVENSLEQLEQACKRCKAREGDLMPTLVDAARKGVTNGEMMEVMRGAFGWVVME